ncbi:PPM-type phosphatase-like domain, partial [Dillenia turbinata]
METTGKVVVNVNGENENFSDGSPPNHPLSSACKQCFNTTRVASRWKKSLLRHPSRQGENSILEQGIGIEDSHMNFTPIVRSGACVDIGFRSSMEDLIASAKGPMPFTGDGGPLSAEPEFMSTRLTEEDEFLVIGCDGLWDVFRSQNAVDFARLQEHNDPAVCCKELVDEALKRNTGGNLAVVV